MHNKTLKDVVDIFRTDRQADRVRMDPLIQKLLPAKLGVCRGRGMNDEGFHVRHVRKQRKQLQIIYEHLCLFCISLDFESKNGTAAVNIFTNFFT